MRLADGLNGMDLRTLRRSILPYGLTLLIHLGHPILMGHEDMPVAHQHGIADLSPLQLILIRPVHLSILHDEHPPLFTLPGIEEIMPRQTRVNF